LKGLRAIYEVSFKLKRWRAEMSLFPLPSIAIRASPGCCRISRLTSSPQEVKIELTKRLRVLTIEGRDMEIQVAGVDARDSV
jgi:hypothetical protein